MIRNTKKKGFTLVEIMIVVAIIGLLAAIAIPNFVNARQKAMQNACIANLKQIQGAVQVWAIDNSQAADAQPTRAQLEPNYIKTWPSENGTAYAVPAVDEDPACPNVTANPTHHL